MKGPASWSRGGLWLLGCLTALGCGGPAPVDEPPVCVGDPTPFAGRVVSFTPGEFAGFGQEDYPSIVFGPPHGAGAGMGSLDVLSLGRGGEIVLETGFLLVDGPGVDLLVFENPFVTFAETGSVAVSEDGHTWWEFPCAATDKAGGYPGCAGVHPVFSSPDNGLSPTDPEVAGGDGFDLATLGVDPEHFRGRYVRIRDSGQNVYGSLSGGFDLDAIAVVHGVSGCDAR